MKKERKLSAQADSTLSLTSLLNVRIKENDTKSGPAAFDCQPRNAEAERDPSPRNAEA